MNYSVDVSSWVLVPDVHLTPVLGSVCVGEMALLGEELDSTLTSEENTEDSHSPPLEEMINVESDVSPGGRGVDVPFRVCHPPTEDPVDGVQLAKDLPEGVHLEVETHTNLQTETELERLRKDRLFEDTRASLRMEKERDRLRRDLLFEEESLKKVVEEKKQLEETFLGKRSAALGEHKASLAFMNQLTLRINELEKKKQLVWEETKSLSDRNTQVGTIILSKQLEVANFETVLEKQSKQFNSLKKNVEELEFRLATARSLSTSDHVVENSKEDTFETATDGSPQRKDDSTKVLVGILKPTTVETVNSGEGTDTLTENISETDCSLSVQEHGDDDLDSRENERTFMDILCSRIDKIVVNRMDEMLVETDSIYGGVEVLSVTAGDCTERPTIAGMGVTSTPLLSSNTAVLPALGGQLDLSSVVQPMAHEGFLNPPVHDIPTSTAAMVQPTPPTSHGWVGVDANGVYGSGVPRLTGTTTHPRQRATVNNSSTITRPGSGTVSGTTRPEERQRHNMSAADLQVYQSNPAIRAMGIDSVPSDIGNAKAVEWSLRTAGQVAGAGVAPVKKHAMRPKPFDGSLPWKKWFTRFAADMRHNNWTGDECLASLTWCLRDCPADGALTSFEQSGDGTYEGLVECVAWAFGSNNGVDRCISKARSS